MYEHISQLHSSSSLLLLEQARSCIMLARLSRAEQVPWNEERKVAKQSGVGVKHHRGITEHCGGVRK